ncbi:hypothetical protein KDU71_21830 [Carboxylicivirga sediminis]|uniref:beta-galactosidase n=1 Tax=Carboxylicivirga sediminis TaxID=2006564 RepID=A0A941J304_9BACT|nr:glycoside hydrolase family 2 TIM barrel-domain containing protein [Carboxylicivirga sediminis]MBR8538227.1 hypothetical protein [Carboxylicivirga sediminis]
MSTIKVDLGGEWHFSHPRKYHRDSSLKGSENSHDIQVPGEWTMQGFSLEPGETGIYQRDFAIPDNWKNSTVYLRCDAVFSKAVIKINGQIAGTHKGPMMAFEFDVTDYLTYTSDNAISLEVTAETLPDTLMSGTQYAAHQMGGILRKIFLYAVPQVHLSDLSIKTDLDRKYENAVLKVDASINCKQLSEDVSIVSRLFDPKGKEVKLNNSKHRLNLNDKGKTPLSLSFAVNKPLKWDAEHPHLYRLEMDIHSRAGTEKIVKYIGFRVIEVVGNELYVNGKPVKLKGVNHHEVHPLMGRSLNPELWKLDVELLKKANVNYLRTSHYPTSEEFVEWCDKLGIYVELENPLCWIGHHANKHWVKNAPEDNSFYPYFEEVAKLNIGFFRNHPSIIMWSMANESKWTHNWSKLADFYKQSDPSRPVTFHDQAYGGFNNYGSGKMPVANIHYPGTGGPKVAEDFNRPLLFGEFAHLNTYNRVEIVTDPGVRDVWGRGFKSMWEGMYASRGCLGGAIWSGIDDVFYLPDGRAVGYGEWGPIDGWRREKPEYYHMKKSYSPVKVHNLQIAATDLNKGIQLQVENRFDFTDLEECSIHWTLETESGQARMSLAPKQSGILTIHPKSNDLNGKILYLTFASPQGIEVEKCAVEIGEVQRNKLPFSSVAQSALHVEEEDGCLKVDGESFSWLFDMQKGKVKEATVEGETVLKMGAELMMLKLTTGECLTEHSLDIPFYNEVCSHWEVSTVTWTNLNDTIAINVEGTYDQAVGTIKYQLSQDGVMTITYDFESLIEMNPRQWGIVFTTSANVNHLKWYRRGLWSSYPDNHIGRINGEAIPFATQAFLSESFGQQPDNDWRYDANRLGTNDFRATRENIYWASLTSEEGKGMTVISDGTQGFRAFVNPDKTISFLLTDYTTGGGDLFFSGHYSNERIKLNKGSNLHGIVKLQLVKSNL